MKNQIPLRDYELISAYLDNQLGNQERARLDARLKADPELRQELQEISKTRLLVRNLPKLRAPRNYFISEKVSAKVSLKPVRVHPTLRLTPSLGIVSAIATILLAFVIFGDSLLPSTSPVAMVPALVAPNETLAVQEEVQRSVVSTSSPTEAAPVVLMGAPMIASPTPPSGAFKVGQSGNPTSTTIYLYAYPPTSTPENPYSIYDEQTEITTISCAEYYGSGVHPTLPYLYYCPTPTQTLSEYLQSILLTSTPTPTATSTPEPTSAPLLGLQPTPIPTEAPSSIMNVAPTSELDASSGIAPPDHSIEPGNTTPTGLESAEKPGITPNIGFMRYLVLAVEISLAGIAIIAGIAAIILRIRAGR